MSGLRTRLRRESGFTAVELIVAMPAALLILGGTVFMLTTLMRWNTREGQQTTNQIEARAALNRIADDVRSAFIGDGTAPVTSASATSMTLYAPDRVPTTTSGSTMTSFHLQEISYNLTGGQLQRQFMTSTNTFPAAPPWNWPGSMGGWGTLVSGLTNSTVFSYYSNQGLTTTPITALSFPITDTSQIQAVGITLTLAAAGNGIAGSKPLTVSDVVAIRGSS